MRTDAPARTRSYFAAADVLRVVCIALVGWYHIWQQSWLDPGFHIGSNYVNLQQVVRNGYMMVDVLLVLSGFLLALPYARARTGLCEKPSTKEFYVKRFWRIVPSYTLGVLISLFFWALPQGLYASPDAIVRDVLAHFTFTHNLFYETYFHTPLLGVLWTMGVEVQFYVLFPLVARAYEKRPALTCLALALAGLGVRAWVCGRADTLIWVNQLPCMLDLFACGMAAAALYVRLAERPIPAGIRWALAAGALFMLCVMLQIMYTQTIGDGENVRRGQLLLRLPLGLAAGAFLLCGTLAPPVLSRMFGNPVTRFLSAISYNFYIWHQFLAVRLKAWHLPDYTAELPNQVGEQPWQTRYTLLCFACAIAVGAAVTYLVERPIYKKGIKNLR